jgi:hypothetical protein
MPKLVVFFQSYNIKKNLHQFIYFGNWDCSFPPLHPPNLYLSVEGHIDFVENFKQF